MYSFFYRASWGETRSELPRRRGVLALSTDTDNLELNKHQVVKGTANPDGPFSRGVQKGAAYVYRRSPTTGEWYEEAKLFLDDGEGTDRYGWQVRARAGGPADGDFY